MAPSVHTTPSALRELRCRIDRWSLEVGDQPVLGALVSKEIAHADRRQERMADKAAKVAEALEADGEPLGPVIDAEYTVAAENEVGEAGPGPVEGGDSGRGGSTPRPPEPERKRKGHGRNGAGAYANAKHFVHALLIGVVGAICEACGVGRMSAYREKLIVHIKGQPLFGAEVHHFEQARCRLCGATIRADPADVVLDGLGSSYIKYDWSACAMLLVMHYFGGLPFKRLESLHAGWGIPMADANQWTLADKSADLLFPLYKALEKHGVQNAYSLRIDDTGSMIIDVRRQIRSEIAALEMLGESTRDVRTGINATGVYLETEQGKVLLFFTGRHHASEIIDQLLENRRTAQNKNKLVKVSDAASKNFSHAHGDELEEAVCNAHAFLKFRAVKDEYPAEYSLAGEVYKKVFDNDDAAKAQNMSPHRRMLHHREHSLPEMKRLKKMCSEKLEKKLVEPNSPLWEPLTFIINQWERLKKFCEVPGVPLDTNVVEQMLIIPVRYLTGSFDYKTQNGADVGDRHMSFIATANANGVEPAAYLTECLQNHEDLAKRPEYYLPWVYKERLKALDASRMTAPPSTRSSTVQAVEHPLRPGTHRAHPSRAIEGTADPPSATEFGDDTERIYATFRQSSGNEHVDGSPPQIRT